MACIANNSHNLLKNSQVECLHGSLLEMFNDINYTPS